MTLFGFSKYQDRLSVFWARQRAKGFVPYHASTGYQLYLIVAVMVLAGIFFAFRERVDPVRLLVGLVALAAVITIAQWPMVFRRWSIWYKGMSSADRAEYWGLKRQGWLYALCLGIAFILFVALLFLLDQVTRFG